jgi:hypothetical protein
LKMTVGLQEIANLAVAYTEAMFQFDGHGEHDGAERVAAGADGIGVLLGMSTLPLLSVLSGDGIGRKSALCPLRRPGFLGASLHCGRRKGCAWRFGRVSVGFHLVVRRCADPAERSCTKDKMTVKGVELPGFGRKDRRVFVQIRPISVKNMMRSKTRVTTFRRRRHKRARP